MNSNFSCTAIFCDDIRLEINGKASLMGIYNYQMFLPDFPITLSKLCAQFDLRTRPDFDFSEAILTVMKGAEKISSITIPVGSAENIEKPDHGKNLAYKSYFGALELASITFNEPTLMEILTQIDGQVEVSGRLWVTTFPSSVEIKLNQE
jgi:hypothetical protein